MHIVKSFALAVLMLALAVCTVGTGEAAQWDGGTIRVVGLGVAPAGTSGTQAEALARRAAISDAYRQLAEQVNGVNVDASTTVENLMLANMTVRTHVSALIKGVEIREEKAQRDGSYTVTLELPVYGSGSLASTVFAPNMAREPWTPPATVYTPYTPQNYDTTGYGTYDRAQMQNSAANRVTAPTPLRPSTPAAVENPLRPTQPAVTTPAAPTEPAQLRPTHPTPQTSTMPDASAPTVQSPVTPAPTVQPPAAPVAPAPIPAPTPAPAVQTPIAPTTPPAEIVPTGQAVGGYTGVIIDCTGLGLRPAMSPVIKAENGRPIYGYKNLDSDKVVASGMASYARSDADATRAGTNPLRLRAVSIDGGANPVLSANDANRLLLENNASGFLDATNVVFLR
ncbi:LPP20 family lipoprotein [uncultured Selenomonas sp.]|uniref:LPP20 family lipoprotein n=1 Tax=uncultured Selenomonas sp. TaxID=159275 RepID=UPI0028E9CFE8|nr:LPP20 family lipoprotein [uncultured Selenomonas sp.]